MITKSRMAGKATSWSHRRPAHQRRNRAGGAADHDVLRGQPLRPHRVDHHVEEAAAERQQRRPAGSRTPRARQTASADSTTPNAVRPARRDPAGRDRPRRRARPHQPVDVAVEHVVQRAGAAAGQRAADDQRRQRQPAAGRRRARRRSSRSTGGQHQQRHDPRLGQRHVVAPRWRSRAGRARAQGLAAPRRNR